MYNFVIIILTSCWTCWYTTNNRWLQECYCQEWMQAVSSYTGYSSGSILNLSGCNKRTQMTVLFNKCVIIVLFLVCFYPFLFCFSLILLFFWLCVALFKKSRPCSHISPWADTFFWAPLGGQNIIWIFSNLRASTF